MDTHHPGGRVGRNRPIVWALAVLASLQNRTPAVRILVQRVTQAHVTVKGEVIGSIGAGLLLLIGVAETDDEATLRWMARKCGRLRIFGDADGRMNRSLLDVGGEALCVSQFTLYGDARKGNRPSFVRAARPGPANALYEKFCAILSEEIGAPVARGRFGAMMQVQLVNDGPVTIWLERDAERQGA